MGIVLLILTIIVLAYILYGGKGVRRQYRRSNSPYNCDLRSLNDIDNAQLMYRDPVHDDTSRISNQMFWMSDYSHPERDFRKNLNDDVITPVRPVAGINEMRYMSGVHQVSRFGCERSE
jgi:hypothetical protein